MVLAWCLWLLGVWAGTLWIEGRAAPSPAAGRLMVLLMLLWLLALWPAARLSQGVDRGSARWQRAGVIAVDWGSMLLLLQAVVWALGLMAGWDWVQTLLVDAAVTAWSLLAAGVVAGGRLSGRGWVRTLAMGVCAAIAFHEPVLAAVGVELRGWPGPLGAAFELTVPGGRFEPGRWRGWAESLGMVGAGACLTWAGVVLGVWRRGDGRGGGNAGDTRDTATEAAAPGGFGVCYDVSSGSVGQTSLGTERSHTVDFITSEERAQLQAKLDERKGRRGEITTRIAEARALGDLKENAEYHSARDEQGLNEAEIRRLEERLATAQTADDIDKPDDMVFLGSTVKLRDLDDDDEDVYKLVGESTGNFDADFIEVTVGSPMGAALLKARVGETVKVDLPRGTKRFEVVELV